MAEYSADYGFVGTEGCDAGDNCPEASKLRTAEPNQKGVMGVGEYLSGRYIGDVLDLWK